MNRIFSYKTGCQKQSFTQATIMLVALALSACQSMPTTEQSDIAGNLSINMLDMSYAPSKLNVTQPGHLK